MTVKITGPIEKFTPDDNHPFRWAILQATSRGSIVERNNGSGSLTIADARELTLQMVLGLVGFGMEVEGWPAFIKMNLATYNGAVPGYLPPVVDDSRSVIANAAWSQWKDGEHGHMDAIDGDKIVPGNSLDGTELPGSLVKLLDNDPSGNYTILSSSELGQYLDQSEE